MTAFPMPDVEGVTAGCFDMARSGRLPPPETWGDDDVDRLLGLRGLEPFDVQADWVPKTRVVPTPAGDLPFGRLRARRDPVIRRCLDALAARRTWLTMLKAADEDPARPPAWAVTIASWVADDWIAAGGDLADLHSRLVSQDLREPDVIEARGERWGAVPAAVTLPSHPDAAVVALPTGSRMILKVIAQEWLVVDRGRSMAAIQIDRQMPETLLVAMRGRRLGEVIRSSPPIFCSRDPVVLRVRQIDEHLLLQFPGDARPMAPAPRRSLRAVGLDLPLPPDVCPWWAASVPTGRRK